MDLLSGLGKQGVQLNLLQRKVDVEDTEFLSKYFVLQEFQPTLTAGKNSITFNGSELLKNGSEVLVECLDSDGNQLYIESTLKTNIAYKEGSSYILSIHVYSETSNGPGKLILYGTLLNGRSVRWIGNILIDKTLTNSSTVRFYNKPIIEVSPVLSPVIAYVGDLNKIVELTGSFYSYAVTPQKDTLKLNKRNVDVDYRIFSRNTFTDSTLDTTGSFNSQLLNSEISLHIKTIQEPYSSRNKDTFFTSSVKIKRIINSSTLVLDTPVYYKDNKKNDVVVNVIDGDFYLRYPYISYNTASESSSYLIANSSEGAFQVKHSYADVIYRNLRTFSGFISRHKLYRKSLFSPGDFEVIADEPLSPQELLKDKLTTNKSFDNMGYFYNQRHLEKYWFLNGNNIQYTQSSNRLNEAMEITCPSSLNTLNSLSNYIIVKDNSSSDQRTAEYINYDSVEFSNKSGSSYDSNFIELKKDVNYILSSNVVLKKDSATLNEVDAGLEFYFTSSTSDINLELNAVKDQTGLLKLGSINISEPVYEKYYDNNQIIFSTTHDLFGTLIIIPKKCSAIISSVSLKPYGDRGFSPDILITRIPFPVSVANESFEIKSELFDINSNLVYSDLRIIKSFDEGGDSLRLFIPGIKDPSRTAYLSGSLEISQSLLVNENVDISGSFTVVGTINVNGLSESTYTSERMLCWDSGSGQMRYSNLNDISNNDNDEITITLFEKNSSTKLTPFRLIPCVEGRNISVI
jgi:hypothetical protein